jgi:hypothetical protein
MNEFNGRARAIREGRPELGGEERGESLESLDDVLRRHGPEAVER